MRNVRTIAQACFFVLVRPVFPFLQWLGKVSGLATRAKTVEGPHLRQPYVVGRLRTGISMRELVERLRSQGFFHEPVAYPDPGQILSMRRLDEAKPYCQFHVRIFSDNEVRGHYEYTPEDRPFGHMNEELFEPRMTEFRAHFGQFLEETADL